MRESFYVRLEISTDDEETTLTRSELHDKLQKAFEHGTVLEALSTGLAATVTPHFFEEGPQRDAAVAKLVEDYEHDHYVSRIDLQVDPDAAFSPVPDEPYDWVMVWEAVPKDD